MKYHNHSVTYVPATLTAKKVPNASGRTYAYIVREPQFYFGNRAEGRVVVGFKAQSASGKIRSFRFDRIQSFVPIAS
jgi:hypothetical protein